MYVFTSHAWLLLVIPRIPAAVELAAAADTVVLALGVDLSWAHEGHDSTTLAIPDAQVQRKIDIGHSQSLLRIISNHATARISHGLDTHWCCDHSQMQLVTQTTAAAKSPVTVVFFCANPLDISALLSNPKIGK